MDMVNHKLICVHEETKDSLDSKKLCPDESYNAVIKRLLKSKEDNQI